MCMYDKQDLEMAKEFADGYGKGLTTMKRLVLSVFREHPHMNKQEIEQYIKENL